MELMKALCASVLVAPASTAFAGNIAAPTIEEAPMAPIAPPAPASDWTGFYGGLQYNWADISPDGIPSDNGDGFGVHAGYLHDFDKIVLGGELDYNWLDVFGGDVEIFRAKALAGYDVGRFLPYLTIGYADVSIDAGGGSDNGFSYGLGGIYKVTDNIGLGLEYTRTEVDEIGGLGVDTDLVQLRASYHF